MFECTTIEDLIGKEFIQEILIQKIVFTQANLMFG